MPPAADIARRIALLAGAIVSAAGVVVFSGWILDIPTLKSIHPGWPNMTPAAAGGFAMAGAALVLTAVPPRTPDRFRLPLAGVLAAATAILGFLKLADYGFGLNLNFGTLGFEGRAHIAPSTALDFLLVGGALWLAGGTRHFGAFQFLTLACAVVGAVGLAVYLYGGEPLYAYAEMALHTSLLFLLLSLGVLCSRTDGGLMALLVSPTAGGWLALRMLLLIPPVPLAIEWLEHRAVDRKWLGAGNPTPLFALLDVLVLAALIWVAGNWLRRVDEKRAREEAQRREHEAQVRLFVEYAPAAIAMLDRDMRYLAVSRRWLVDYRLEMQEIRGRSHYDVFPDLPPKWQEIHRRCLAGGIESCEEDLFPRADGGVDWIQWAMHPWYDANGEVGGVMLFSEVITGRVHAAERIQRLNRVYAVLSQINSLIVRVPDRQEVFDESCRIAVEHGKFGFAWIGMYHAETQAIVPVASAGFTRSDPLLTEIDVSEGSPYAQSIPAQVLRQRQAVFDNDIAAGRSMENDRYREILEHGFHSVIALPLIVDDAVAGIISMWAQERGYFDKEELKLLDELAADISFALQVLKRKEELDYMSFFDVLTGLPNRKLILDRLNQMLSSYDSNPRRLALLLLDIERFSMVNNTFGRHGADEFLRVVARRLEDACHGKDNLARIGADKFAIVLPEAGDAGDIAHRVENRLLACFRQPFILGGTELRVSAKLGVAEYPIDGRDAETLFRNAEFALKEGKSSGSRYVFYDEKMNAQAAQSLLLETRLRQAVEAREFVLYYQPKVRLDDGRLVGLEGLMRWQSPEYGLMPPMKFIPVLEETGLIVEVGKWAVERALADFDAWTTRGYQVPRIAVNVSAVQLREDDFASSVVDLVRGSGMSPQALELEITENLVMQNIERNIRAFSILRNTGVEIAIDDFGTGYSSLSYLSRLPVDRIKIDRSFINGMTESAQDSNVVSTIIALARSFRLAVVAEGVETHEQAQALNELGCNEAQGYFFCKPLPPEEIAGLLANPPLTGARA